MWLSLVNALRALTVSFKLSHTSRASLAATKFLLISAWQIPRSKSRLYIRCSQSRVISDIFFLGDSIFDLWHLYGREHVNCNDGMFIMLCMGYGFVRTVLYCQNSKILFSWGQFVLVIFTQNRHANFATYKKTPPNRNGIIPLCTGPWEYGHFIPLFGYKSRGIVNLCIDSDSNHQTSIK